MNDILKANNLGGKLLEDYETEGSILLRVVKYPDAIHPLFGYEIKDGARRAMSRGNAYFLAKKIEKKEAGEHVHQQSGGTSKDYENQVQVVGFHVYKFSEADLKVADAPSALPEDTKLQDAAEKGEAPDAGKSGDERISPESPTAEAARVSADTSKDFESKPLISNEEK